MSASGTWSRCFEAYSLRATLPVSVREIGVRWQQCWPDGAIGQLDVILVTSFAFQPRHGMPSFQTALGHGIQPSLSVDVECNMTANMFSIMRATFTLQRALVNERSLADCGRDTHYWAPPAQNRTGSFPAYGSHLGCLTAGLGLPYALRRR